MFFKNSRCALVYCATSAHLQNQNMQLVRNEHGRLRCSIRDKSGLFTDGYMINIPHHTILSSSQYVFMMKPAGFSEKAFFHVRFNAGHLEDQNQNKAAWRGS